MAGQIITLPIRLSARAASVLLRGGERIAARALSVAVQATGIIRSREEHAYDEPPVAERPVADEPPAPTPSTRPQTEAEVAIDFDAPPEAEPAHISEEPVLAAELAEPGAEDGAGAEVRIDEPWAGYARLRSDEVIARLSAADAAELAAILLFENANRRRQTVLSAVERQLALANRGS